MVWLCNLDNSLTMQYGIVKGDFAHLNTFHTSDRIPLPIYLIEGSGH